MKDIIKFINEDIKKSVKYGSFQGLSDDEIDALAIETDLNKDEVIQEDELALLINKMLNKQKSVYEENIKKLQGN